MDGDSEVGEDDGEIGRMVDDANNPSMRSIVDWIWPILAILPLLLWLLDSVRCCGEDGVVVVGNDDDDDGKMVVVVGNDEDDGKMVVKSGVEISVKMVFKKALT